MFCLSTSIGWTLSGTELVDQLRERNFPLPSIVFVTAHLEHAITAFEKHTVDYVLKPFSNEQIGEAWTGPPGELRASEPRN